MTHKAHWATEVISPHPLRSHPTRSPKPLLASASDRSNQRGRETETGPSEFGIGRGPSEVEGQGGKSWTPLRRERVRRFLGWKASCSKNVLEEDLPTPFTATLFMNDSSTESQYQRPGDPKGSKGNSLPIRPSSRALVTGARKATCGRRSDGGSSLDQTGWTRSLRVKRCSCDGCPFF